jgi:hypothetical protein
MCWDCENFSLHEGGFTGSHPLGGFCRQGFYILWSSLRGATEGSDEAISLGGSAISAKSYRLKGDLPVSRLQRE